MPPESIDVESAKEIDLIDLWQIVWRSKWQVIAVTSLFIFASVSYALLATEWYRAEVVLSPVDNASGQSFGGQFGSLAALAGISVGSSGNVEAVATLKSRDFAEAFIEDNNLLPILFADDWDAARRQWSHIDSQDWPDIRDGVEFFTKDVRKVEEDIATGLVTLAVEWKDPVLAAAWANELVERLNEHMRQRTLLEAWSNIEYLQAELAAANLLTLQQSIGRLLESEVQKVMVARGNEQFSFRIIDRAQVPKKRERPKRALIVIVATLVGGLLGVVAALVRNALSLRAGTADG